MKRKTRVLLSLTVALLMVFNLSACATYDAFYSTFINKSEETYETVKIGVFQPLSGSERKYGELEKTGIELAHDVMPQCLGKDVELVYADNESDIYVAEAKIQELISKEPAIILGSYGSVYSLIAGDYIEEAKIPAIAITNTNPLVTSANPYYFRVAAVDSYQAVALAKFTYESLGVTEAAIMRPGNNDVATAFSSAYEDKLVQMTGNQSAIVKTIEYKSGETDFESQLSTIKVQNIKAVFLPVGAQDAIRIITQAHSMGINATFIGTEAWNNDEFTESLGDAASLAVYATDFDADTSLNETSQVFMEAYHKAYGEDAVPEPAVALAFDAYMIAVEAINRIGTVKDGELLAASVKLVSQYPGASGNITLDENGDPLKTIVIKGMVNGALTNIYVMEPAIVTLGI